MRRTSPFPQPFPYQLFDPKLTVLLVEANDQWLVCKPTATILHKHSKQLVELGKAVQNDVLTSHLHMQRAGE